MDEGYKSETEPPDGVTGQCISTLNKMEYIDGIGWVKMHWCVEYTQDQHAQLKSMFKRRTPDFTNREIKDWHEVWEIIKDCNFETIKEKYKMHILKEDGEYEDHYGDCNDEVMLQGWVGGIFEENWQVFDLTEYMHKYQRCSDGSPVN